jgi:hypothetical protein
VDYNQISTYAKAAGHKRFCAPLAMSLVTGYDFDECHKLLTNWGYRKSKTSATKVGWSKVLTQLGFTLTKVGRSGIKTNVSLKGKLNPNKKFIVAYSRHIAAYVDGQLEDWSADKRNRIISIYEVRRV